MQALAGQSFALSVSFSNQPPIPIKIFPQGGLIFQQRNFKFFAAFLTRCKKLCELRFFRQMMKNHGAS